MVYSISYELTDGSTTDESELRGLLAEWEATHVLGRQWIVDFDGSPEIFFYEMERQLKHADDRLLMVELGRDSFFGTAAIRDDPRILRLLLSD